MACMKDQFIKGLVLGGRYESVSPLNHGSFGMVFLAKDITTESLVAIKCLSKASGSLQNNPTASEDHTVELACHERLGCHPNIVNLLHSFETDSHIYLVLEFCSMGDLYEAIRLGRGPLQTENVREFMLQLVDAVDFMHSKGLYHRDIKPENIFLAQDGSMKLGDFGLATTDSCSLESAVGSDRYMAPEQYDPPEVGYSPAKADIWAIGICLLNVLFSRNPFVTPTESDKLFADFARDNQALFDIFSNMSQDTFDVLAHALAIDPAKRSLASVREKLQKVVSFTTDDEVLDDFCNDDHAVVPPTANREPLRTPSIQSPQVDHGNTFPWAKALQMSPHAAGRQLSAIPDNESFSEDLFPPSERDRQSWYSVAQNSSLTSGLDSILEASVKSMVFHQPAPRNTQSSDQLPISGSLPPHSSKPLPALSSVFGNKSNSVSKSWIDLWDEDEEDFVEHEEALQKRREHNARTWSQESKDEDLTFKRPGLSEIKSSSAINSRTQSPHHHQSNLPADDGHGDGEFVFEDAVGLHSTPRYSPPSKRHVSPPAKRSIMDKWAALGNRRRNFQDNDGDVTPQGNRKRTLAVGSWRDGLGFKALSSSYGWGGERKGRQGNSHSRMRNWRRDAHTHQQQKEHDGDPNDFEWVGGWRDLHL